MNSVCKKLVTVAATLSLMAGLSWIGPSVHAQEAAVSVQISVKNHRFQPAEIHVGANKPIMLRIKNLDATPMEFESVTLRVEKVVTGNSEGIIRLRALSPGRYDFFDDFHPETRGTLVVQ
jgi:Cupredoxin-like domain